MAHENKNDETRGVSKVLGFRVSEAEYEAVTLVADVRELSVAEYLRDRVDIPAIVEDANRIRERARVG